MRLLKLFMCCLLFVTLIPAVLAQKNNDDETKARLKALKQAVDAIGKSPTDTPPEIQLVDTAQVCWCPHGQFSPAGLASEVSFGTNGLAVQWQHGLLDRETNVTVTWYFAGQEQPMSIGTVVAGAGSLAVANGIVKPEGPLLPGLYEIYFDVDGIQRAKAQLIITPPAPVDDHNADSIYLQSLQALQDALQKIDASQGQAAGEAATRALPGLGTVMYARPKDRTVQGIYELAQAIIAVGKMEAIAPLQQPDVLLDWALRSHAHAQHAQKLITDETLQATAGQFVEALDKVLPQLQAAANVENSAE